MTTHTGRAGELQIQGAPIAQLTSWTIETTSEALTADEVGKPWRLYKKGLKGFSLTGEGYYDMADAGQAGLDIGSKVEFMLYPAGDDEAERHWYGDTFVTSYAENAGFDGMVSFTCSLQGTAALKSNQVLVCDTVLDPAHTSPSVTLDNGGLLATFIAPDTAPVSTRSTTSHSSGKWVFEVSAANNGDNFYGLWAGLCVAGQQVDTIPGAGDPESDKGYGVEYFENIAPNISYLYHNGIRENVVPSLDWLLATDVVMFLVNLDDGILSVISPSGTRVMATGLATENWYVCLGGGGPNAAMAVNFGPSGFTNPVPAGYEPCF